MVPISAIAQHPDVQAAIRPLHDDPEALLNLIVALQQIPAPTFEEATRANYVEATFRRLGLVEVGQDALHNVYGRVPGSGNGTGLAVVVSAHLDTVFPAETNLAVSRNGVRLYGPGIGDNSTGVAGIITLAEMLTGLRGSLERDVWIVANVGEEGLGDLRGMRAVVDRFGEAARYVVVEGGLFGQLSCEAVGVRRYRVDIHAPGGHSWGSFGSASAIHALGHLIADLTTLDTPDAPKTTYNIGLVEGGTSINTIAQSASLWLDLRSEQNEALEALVAQAMAIIERRDRRHRMDLDGVTVQVSEVGNRPAGSLSRSAPLVCWADEALHEVGCRQVRYIASSTDANIPLSRGYEAVCLGLTESGNAHRLDEHIDTTQLPAGMTQLLLVTLAAAGIGA